MLLDGSIGFQLFQDTFHFSNALFQTQLLLYVFPLALKEFGEAISLGRSRAGRRQTAFFDRRDEEPVYEFVRRAAVLEIPFDATFGLVDGSDFIPFRRDDLEMFLQVLTIGQEGIIFRKEPGCHGVLGDTAEIGRHFFLRRRPGLALVAADKGQRVQAHLGRWRIFQGEFLTGQLFLAVHEKGDRCQGIAPRLVFEDPFDGNVGDGIVQLQRFLYLALGYGLARQNSLDQGLDEDGLAGPVFQ